MIWPAAVSAPPPDPHMPDDVRAVYEEARQVESASPRAAAGLLRLALQLLLKPFVDGETNLNKAIKAAAENGLAQGIAVMAMDVVRIKGNDGVHPSEIQIDEDPELLPALFGLVNIIIDRLIGEPARVKALFDSLPGDKLEQIKRRDGTA